MRNVSQGFKEQIKLLGKQIDVQITYNTNDVLDSEDINSAIYGYEGNLLKSIMKTLVIDSNVNLPKDTEINLRCGLLVNSAYEYINYGNFIVTESNKKEDTDSYELKCYDKMIYSMKEYEPLNLTYPCTIETYIRQLASKLGLNINLTSGANLSLYLNTDVFQDIGFTYRDVLDDLAEATGTTIYIKNNNVLTLGVPTYSGFTVDEENLKDVNVNFGEKYGPINSIVLSRANESDNVYYKDDASVLQNGLTEVKIIDNEIMNFNDRSDYLQGIASNLFGVEYYLNDYSSTGIMILDILDYYDVAIFGNTYKCLMLNDEIQIVQGLEENVYTERPETSVTDYTKADKTDQRLNQTYRIVDKQNQTIQDVVTNVTEQNNKISRVEQTVDSLNSKISDIADITVSRETNTGRLIFDNINQSEPIHIEIHPIGESITALHPRNNLKINNGLYIQLRRLKFTNTTTGEIFTYEIPADLLYYDSNNYDTFVMDYASLTCYINKKCEYDANGNVVLLANERTDSYPFTHIELTDGDYTVEVFKYDNSQYTTLYNCYLFVRLMAQNIYTTQFATKSELNSEINQTTQSITESVNAKLTNYSTTTQMNSQIQLKANEITNTVSETYETKDSSNSKFSQLTQTSESLQSQINNNGTNISTLQQTAGSLQSQISSNDTDISNLQQTSDSFSVELRRKVNETDFTGANIVLKINNDGSSGSITADKINLDGKVINLTSGNIVIQSNNFNVDKYGNLTCQNATVSGTVNSTDGNIGGWTIDGNGLTNGTVFIHRDGSSTLYTVADLIIVRNYIRGIAGFELSGSVLQHYDLNGDGRVTSSDYVTLKNLIGLDPG